MENQPTVGTYTNPMDPMENGFVKMEDINDSSISGTTSGQASGPVNIYLNAHNSSTDIGYQIDTNLYTWYR